MSNSSAHALRIGDQESVIMVAERMAPFCYKKKPELEVLLDYRKRDLISGTEVQRRFKRFVELGIRERHGNRLVRPMPWPYSVGYHLSRKSIALLSHGLGKKLSKAQMREIQERHNIFGESISALSRYYEVSRSMIWRALRH